MQKNRFLKFIIAATLLTGLLSGCASDMPIKTVHNEGLPTNVSDGSVETIQPTPVTPPASSLIGNTTPAKEAAVERKDDLVLTELDIQKFAYELGFDPKKTLKNSEVKQITDRKKLRRLERALDSQKERLQYSKVLPWLKGDEEKIEILSIPTVEGRQVWINKNKIWSRAKSLEEFDEIVESQDIALGMPTEYVKKSWGEPDSVEASGNPVYRNERWQYNKQVATPQGYKQERRLVYFEGGRVVGWETE